MSKLSGTKKQGLRREETGNITPYQLERQEAVYNLHIVGFSLRRIRTQLTSPARDGTAPKYANLGEHTMVQDIERERVRRAAKNGDKAEEHRQDAIAYYEIIKQKAIAAGPDSGSRWITEGVKAQERIDKIRGLDQPIRLDVGLSKLWERIDSGLVPLMGDEIEGEPVEK
jgi:hypothetical protein